MIASLLVDRYEIRTSISYVLADTVEKLNAHSVTITSEQYLLPGTNVFLPEVVVTVSSSIPEGEELSSVLHRAFTAYNDEVLGKLRELGLVM